jgi:hypothetical protein
MNITAKVTFLFLERPPHAFRYTGSGCYTRISYLNRVDTSCRLIFEEGKEFFDGETADIFIEVLDSSAHQGMYIGMPFELFVCHTKIAEGQISRLI